MRPCDTAEQRLWMGTNQCCSGCRNAATDPNRLADSCVKRYSVRGGNTHAYSNSNSNSNADGDCHSYAECDSDTDGNGNGHPYSYGYAKGDTEASADAASPAVSA